MTSYPPCWCTTLMKRADAIPPNQSLKAQKRARVQESQQANGYPVTFISTTPRPKADQMESQPKPAGVAVIPYVQGVSDRVKRVLKQNNVKAVFKPTTTLASIFKKPKDRPPMDKVTGVVYKVECKDCTFSYVGESKRCWASRSVEHDPARAASKTSAIRHHTEVTDHNIHPRYGRILEINVHNYGKGLFLESLHSELNKNTVNERSGFPRAYGQLKSSVQKRPK